MLEREVILDALKQSWGNVRKASRILDVNYYSLRDWIAKYGLDGNVQAIREARRATRQALKFGRTARLVGLSLPVDVRRALRRNVIARIDCHRKQRPRFIPDAAEMLGVLSRIFEIRPSRPFAVCLSQSGLCARLGCRPEEAMEKTSRAFTVLNRFWDDRHLRQGNMYEREIRRIILLLQIRANGSRLRSFRQILRALRAECRVPDPLPITRLPRSA